MFKYVTVSEKFARRTFFGEPRSAEIQIGGEKKRENDHISKTSLNDFKIYDRPNPGKVFGNPL